MHLLKLITEVADPESYEYIIEEKSKDSPLNMYIKGPFLLADSVNKNKRKYKLDEMQQEILRYQKEMIDTHRSIGELNHAQCHSSSAKILTSEGWKHFFDIKQNEKVFTLNTENENIELKEINKKIDEPYKGKMIRIKGRNINTLVTPNHRFLIKTRVDGYKYITAEELYNTKNERTYSHDFIPKTGIWSVETPKYYILKGLKENIEKLGNYNIDITKDSSIDYKTFIGFLGIWLAEGCTKYNEIMIYQKDEEKIPLIRDLLSKFPDEMKWKERKSGNDGLICFFLADKRLSDLLKPLGDKYVKYIPEEFKNVSADLLDEMIYWFNVGDGRFNTISLDCGDYEVRNIFSVSKRLIEDFNECLLKSGGCGNISKLIVETDHYINKRLVKSENCSPLYLLNIAKTGGIWLDNRFLSITEEEYDGNVYCVSVPNQNFYCMDNGKCFWSGNSIDINPDRACHLVTEIKQNGNLFIGKSKILTNACGQCVRSLISDGVKLGTSSRALGKLTEGKDCNDVSEFHYICNDVVHDPSVSEAFVDGILESKQWVIKENGNLEEYYEKLENSLETLPKHDVEVYIKNQVLDFLKTLRNK